MTKTKTLVITGAVFVVLMGGIIGASQLLASTSSSPAPKPPAVSSGSVSAAPKTTPKTYTAPSTPPTTSTSTSTPASTAPTYTPSKTPNQGTIQAQQPTTTTTTSSGVSVSCNASMTSCNTQASVPITIIPNPTVAQVLAFSWIADPFQTSPPAVGSFAYNQDKAFLEGKQ